jgi:ATP synthase protein I
MDGGVDRGMRVLSYLLSGVLVYGLLGWLADHLLGTAFLLPVGIVLGAAMGVFVIIRRYGSGPESAPDPAAAARRRRSTRPSQEYAIRRIPR